MTYTIQQARPSHIPLIRELSMLIWPQTYNPIIGEQQVAYMLQLFYSPDALKKQMDSGHTFIICHIEEVPVAFAAWSHLGDNIYKLQKIYTLPQHQGKGIGRYLLNHITNELKLKNATALRLNVNRHNHPAIAFYQKTGFSHFAEEDIDIGNGYFMNDHVLQLVL